MHCAMITWVNAYGMKVEINLKCSWCGSEFVEVHLDPCTCPNDDVRNVDGHPHGRCPMSHGSVTCLTFGHDLRPPSIH